MTASDSLSARRAIEALRSGVPSRTVVRALGSGQTHVEERFSALLDAATDPQRAGDGLLLGGGFGSGKSHALEHLAEGAGERGFVVSRIVVSKETPLHDPVKLLRAAVETAVTPSEQGWRMPGSAVEDAAALLDADGPGFASLLAQVSSTEVGLDARFALTLGLVARVQTPEFAYLKTDVDEAATAFWRGGPVNLSHLRKWSKEVGDPRPAVSAVSSRELAHQRLAFLPRLFRAVGWSGWVLLIDEVELIGRYPLLARGRSYAAVADLLTRPRYDAELSLVPVLAVTDDFDAAVLTDKHDRDQVPAKMRAKDTPEWARLADRAVAGMDALARDVLLLTTMDDVQLDRAYASVRGLHGQAYGQAYSWDPPEVPGLEPLQATRMRQHVRAWINEWDLVRLDPDYSPTTEAGSFPTRYDEQPELTEDDST